MRKLLLYISICLIAASVANAQQAAKSIVSVPDYYPSARQSRPNLSRYGADRHKPATATYNDQLILSFVYGNGADSSNVPLYYFSPLTLDYNYGLTAPNDTALWFPDIFWDSATNTATNNTGGAPAITYTETLTSSDTSVTAFAFPVSITVPAGNYAAMSLTFKSGSTDYPSPTTGDTIISMDSVVYQSYFQPFVAFVENTSPPAVVDYPYYKGPEPAPSPINNDMTTGYFKTDDYTAYDWAPFYVPNWAYNSPTGDAYFEQYPYIWFHIAGSGWYDYVDSVFNPNIAIYGGTGDELEFLPVMLWNDSTAIFYGFTGGYHYNVSVGLSFQPFASDWPASLMLDSTSSYTIDSVMVVGSYRRAETAIPASATSVKNTANEIKSYPNPANNVVTISFTLTTSSDVNVSLTNMVGQVVATQKATGANNGSVQFNTSILADGIYFYTLNADAYVATGQIVVSH